MYDGSLLIVFAMKNVLLVISLGLAFQCPAFAQSRSDDWYSWYGWCMSAELEDLAKEKALVHSSDYHTYCSCTADAMEGNLDSYSDLISDGCIDQTYTKQLRMIDYARWRTDYYWGPAE